MKRCVVVSLSALILLVGLSAPIALAQGTAVRVVQPGESLYRVSVRYGNDVQAVAAVNGVTNPNILYADPQLLMSGWAGHGWHPPVWPPQDCYVVRRGDTLARIASWFGTNVHCLAAANGIANPNLIYAGQCLQIPGPGCSPGCTSCIEVYPSPVVVTPEPPGQQDMTRPTEQLDQASCRSNALSAPSTYWCAEFFVGGDLSGEPLLSRLDRSIAFAWGYASPALGVPADNFSVRWTRAMGLPAGNYVITARSDDGVRVYVDSKLVIDAWQVQRGKPYSETLQLLSSSIRTLVVEYFEADGAAEMELTIQPIS